MCEAVANNLFDFAYIPAWYGMLDYLETHAIKENWGFRNMPEEEKDRRKNKKNPILENYIQHTFKRLADERNNSEDMQVKNAKIYMDENIACLNTGLFTPNYKYIYAYFERNLIQNAQNWVLKGFFDDSAPQLADICRLPIRAEYFSDISDLIYDTKLELRVNSAHILDNEENKKRIPESVRNLSALPILFDGAVQLAKKKIESNYRVAVPQYYQGKIQFLIPICLSDMETVDLALTVTTQNGFYKGNTCLTLDMAYNNARLIAKPDDEWLNP